MSEFRDRLAEAIDGPFPQQVADEIADALIESGVVADPTELAELEQQVAYHDTLHKQGWRKVLDRMYAAEAELAELRKYVAGVKNAHTARQADAWDEGHQAGYEVFERRLAGNGTAPKMPNPYRRAAPETTP